MSPSSLNTGPEQHAEAMTTERLAEIEQRHAAATPGPWGTYECGGGGRIDIAADMEHTGHGYRCRREIAQFDEEPIDNDPAHADWDEDDDWAQVGHDAEFIAHTPIDVRDLVAEVKRLKAALRDACDHIAEQDSEIGAQSIRANAAEQRAKDAEDRLWSAAMTRVWTNEDGKKFVFVEDIAPVLLGKADLPEPTTEWGVRYLDGRGDPALTFEARSEAERQLAGARHAGYEAELVTRTTTYGDWTTVPEGGAR